MRWTSHVLKQIRPHHFMKAIFEPKRAIRELKYRYTFSSAVSFCTFLGKSSKDEVRSLLDECSRHCCFKAAENIVHLLKPSSGRGEMGRESEILYVMVRLINPDIVIETGVGAGISSTYTLKAMALNGKGMLYSIDLPDETGLSGWAIPNELKSRWRLYHGSSVDLLPAVLNDTGPIDIFLHDSDHSYEHMMFEFRTIWPYLKNNSIFLAHDVGRNDALFDFCRETGTSWNKVRTFPVLGGFRKSYRSSQ